MCVREAISYGRKIASSLEAEMLLSFVLGLSREYLIAHPEYKISRAAVLQFQKYCKARAGGVPLSYLTHHKEFYGLDFYVDERVFIPRPETEMLVAEAMERIQDTGSPKAMIQGRDTVIYDIGTGSGCIAIALAKNLPRPSRSEAERSSALTRPEGATFIRIVAIDISKGALAVARKNAEHHGVSSRIEFIKSDLLERVMVSLSNHDRQYLGIIANLPYIGTTEHHLIAKEVLEHEPHAALFAGENGLKLYERFFSQILALPNLPKWIIGEIGFLQQEAIEQCIRKYFGNISVQFKNDLSGLPRMFCISF